MRQCGECSQCCKTMAVMALNKPANKWCHHCQIGQGCKIYQQRPEECRAFTCLWLQDESVPEELRPDKTKVVMWEFSEEEKKIVANVDPERPTAYKEGETGRFLRWLVEQGYSVGLRIGDVTRLLNNELAKK